MGDAPKAPKTPKVLPIDYVRDGQQVRDYVGVDPDAKGANYRPTREYFPTAMIVGCTVCNTLGSVDFPRGFDERIGDKIMDGRVVKVFCPRCRGVTECRPLTPKELEDSQFDILRRYMENYRELVVEKDGAIVGPAEIIDRVLGESSRIVREAEEKARKAKKPDDEGPRIITEP